MTLMMPSIATTIIISINVNPFCSILLLIIIAYIRLKDDHGIGILTPSLGSNPINIFSVLHAQIFDNIARWFADASRAFLIFHPFLVNAQVGRICRAKTLHRLNGGLALHHDIVKSLFIIIICPHIHCGTQTFSTVFAKCNLTVRIIFQIQNLKFALPAKPPRLKTKPISCLIRWH